MTISINAIMPIFCNTVIFLLQRNFWLLILIEKINSKKYTRKQINNISKNNIPIICVINIIPKNPAITREPDVNKPIINQNTNHIVMNKPQIHNKLKA